MIKKILTKEDFSSSKTMEVILQNGNRIPIDKYDAIDLNITYDKMFCQQITNSRAEDYADQKSYRANMFAALGIPPLLIASLGVYSAATSGIDEKLLSLSGILAISGLVFMDGCFDNYFGARKFRKALNQQLSHQDE